MVGIIRSWSVCVSCGNYFWFFADGGFLSSSDIDAYNQYQSGLGDFINNLSALENFAVFV